MAELLMQNIVTKEGLARFLVKCNERFGTIKTVQGVAPDANGNVAIPEATTAAEGLMSAADKAKIDGLSAVASSGKYADLTGVPTKVSQFENDANYATVVEVEALEEAVADTYAPLADAALTGVPTAPTAAAGTNTTQIATTAFVAKAVSDVVAGEMSGLATVATTGAYADLTGVPTKVSQFENDANYATVGAVEAAQAAAEGKAATAQAAAEAAAAAVETLEGEVADTYAPIASPALTGVPTAPTAATGTNTTQLATTAFVRAEVAALVGTAGEALDTLGELSAALGNDENFATTVATQIGTKLNAADGIAYAAQKLASDANVAVAAGSAVQAVYFVDGLPVACTYKVEKDVPADAVFTDTTYVAATASAEGLMSAADKAKLDSFSIVSNDEIDAMFA